MELPSEKMSFYEKIKRKILFNFGIIHLSSKWPLYYLDLLGLMGDRVFWYKTRGGIKYLIRASRQDFRIINAILVAKVYHKFINEIKEGSVVVDIGAHIGVFSIFAAKMRKNIKVYCYEPLEENFDILLENAKANNVKNKVNAFKMAVSGKAGKSELYFSDDNLAWPSMFSKPKGAKKTTIECISLNDVFESNKIKKCDFLKMNCEGAEYDIILSSPEECLRKISCMTIEYHPNHKVGQLVKKLENCGFKVTIERPKLTRYSLLYAKK